MQNQGFLPTNVTNQAIKNRTAKSVKVSIALADAELIMGKESTDLGHLSGHTVRSSSPVQSVEWMVKKTGKNASITIQVVSEKGGTETKKVALK